MSAAAARKAWIVAASIGAVEALKDQGICRWNYPLRSLQQHTKTKLASYYQSSSQKRPLSTSSNSILCNEIKVEKMMRTEKSVKKVMDLSCWGPNTVRF